MLQLWLLLAATGARAEFTEHVDFHQLPGGLVAAHFAFRQSLPHMRLDLAHFDFGTFPRAIAELAAHHEVGELRAALARGRWRSEWGVSPVPPASVGVTVEAVLPRSDQMGRQWSALTAALSGLLCASINLVGEQTTTVPQLSPAPASARNVLQDGGVRLRGQLPGEAVCTENLTPWSKLLPCASFAGLSALLNPLRIFDSTFHQFDLDAQVLCTDKACKGKELILNQNLLVVFDLARRGTGVPKMVQKDDTHALDLAAQGNTNVMDLDWTVTQLFDRTVERLCPAAAAATINFVKPAANGTWKLSDGSGREVGGIIRNRDSKCILRQVSKDVVLKQDFAVAGVRSGDSTLPKSPLTVSRHLSGIGQERGGLVVSWRNESPEDLEITYTELLPHYMHIFLSTAHFRDQARGTLRLHEFAKRVVYAPSVLRRRPSQLELQMVIPAGQSVSLEIPFEKALLRYTDYPFDPNRGFDLPGATLEYVFESRPYRLVTPKLLLTMPTPDFTMPYNVITLTSTLIVLFYGTFFNLSFRRFYTGPTSAKRLQLRVKSLAARIWNKFRRK